MLFSELQAYPHIMREENPDYLTIVKYPTDADLIALNRSSAIEELKGSLISRLSLKGDSSNALNDLALNYSDSLQFALTYLQLIAFYQGHLDEEGTLSWMRWKHYLEKFNEKAARFHDYEFTITTVESDLPNSFSYMIA